MADDVSEFTDLNPEELHLVGQAASLFTPLVAKSKGTTKGSNMSKLKKASGELVETVVKALDADVAVSRAAVTAARTDIAQMRAENDLRTALRKRATMKLVLSDNARANGALPPARFGPSSAELFENGSTHSIGEDTGLRYAAKGPSYQGPQQ